MLWNALFEGPIQMDISYACNLLSGSQGEYSLWIQKKNNLTIRYPIPLAFVSFYGTLRIVYYFPPNAIPSCMEGIEDIWKALLFSLGKNILFLFSNV